MKRVLLALLLLLLALPLSAAKLEKATFAGGCFWCMEPPFEKLPGVKSVWSGYTGGTVPSPTYESVSAGGTGHKEAVQITFDPAQVTYAQLLEIFWRNIDPTDDTGQFCDKGDQYRSAIYYHNEEQRRLALASKARITKHRVVTQIVPASPFIRAEPYHQDYYKKNPVRYKFYKFNCGRDARLESLWGKSDKSDN
jgi:peptide-methionine (S)-S-oxide reductase